MIQIARRLPNKTWLRGDHEDDFLVTAIRRWRRRLAASVTQTSLSRWKCARKGRREGDNGQDVLRLPSVPFPWSLAVHNQSLAFRTRLYDAKNEAPEEVAWFSVRSRSLSLPSGRKVKRTANDLGRLRIRLLRRRLGEEDVKKSVGTCSTLCHLFVVTAQLWRENVLFYVLWRRFWIWKWLLRIHLQKLIPMNWKKKWISELE